jgi:hypothetical protein
VLGCKQYGAPEAAPKPRSLPTNASCIYGHHKGLEVIGHESKYGEDPSVDIRCRYYGFSEGETLGYTYEIVEDTLTIWMGERRAPAY